jgi:outer membrane protein
MNRRPTAPSRPTRARRAPHAPRAACAALLAALACPPALSQPAPSGGFVGDLGLGVFARSEVVRGTGTSTLVAPYVYADWGRAFARVDTLGLRLLPVGNGHLELVGRVSTEGWKADTAALAGLGDRSNPVPIGLGTYQRTSIGGFFAYAMHDFTSGGNYLEGVWATKFDVGRVALYPLLGVEYRSGAYVRHLYGIDAARSAASGYPTWTPGGSTVPMAGIAATVPISGPWSLQLQWRHRWLDGAIADSPIVGTRSVDSGHVAVSYAFD